MINADELLFILERLAIEREKAVPSLEDVERILATKNQTEIIQSWRERISIAIWDNKSDVNTANADYIRQSNSWLEMAYMLEIDGVVTYFQTHEPFVDGHIPITLETIKAISKNHADSVAYDAGNSQIFQEILDELGLNDPT